jgi:hypothetical protein
MSTHIIDQIAAVKFPKERTGYTIDYYILATLSGDNNMIDSATNRRARAWNGWRAGQHYECLREACELAGGFCGGGVRAAHGNTTPEGFIKKCRAALDTAPDYDSPSAAFRLCNPAITFTAEEKNNGSKYYFDRLVQLKGQPAPGQVYLRGKVEMFLFNLTEPREAARFIEHLPHKSPLWHHVILHGDGEI